MINKSVIFDTNAYREITRDKDFDSCVDTINQLRYKESKQQINAFISPVVLMELFAHLADKNDPHYDNCKNASAMAYLHSKMDNSDVYRLLADPESLLVKLLFDSEISNNQDKSTYLGELAHKIFENPEESHIDNFRNSFRIICEYVKDAEQNFIMQTFLFIVLPNNPNATDWSGLKKDEEIRTNFLAKIQTDSFILEGAKAMVYKASILAGINPASINDLENKAKAVLNVFPAPLYLNREIMKRVAMSGCDLSSIKKNRGNWLWDIQILHNCAKNSTFDNKEALLVTSDKDMINAAKEAGIKDKIIRLDEYLEKLN